MLITTTDKIDETKIVETLGIVKGTIVQSKNLGRDFMAGMKNLVGGEVKIKGSDLYLALKNYSKVQGTLGKNTGIR